MNRKFWRWVEKFASDNLAKDEARDNWVGIKNEFHSQRGAIAVAADSIENEIHSAWEANGPILVQRLGDKINTSVSDTAVVMKDILDDRFNTMKERDNRSSSIFAGLFGRINVSISGVATELRDKFEQLVRGGEEISRQVALVGRDNYDQTSKIGEELRQLRMKVDENHQLHYKTGLALYDSLSGQIAALKAPSKRHNPAPDLEWIIDNADDLIEAADALKAVRDNHAPRNISVYEAVRKLRKLELYSAMDARDEIEGLVSRWDNDQDSRSPRLVVSN